MNIFKEEDTHTPVILLLAGVAVVLSLPPVKRALLSAGGKVFRSILAVAHDMENNKKQMRQEMQQMVRQAEGTFDFSPEFPDEKLLRFGQKLKKQGRHVAVMTAAGALSIVDRTKPFVDEIQTIIKEAKEQQQAKKNESTEEPEAKSEFERELTKKIPIHPGL